MVIVGDDVQTVATEQKSLALSTIGTAYSATGESADPAVVGGDGDARNERLQSPTSDIRPNCLGILKDLHHVVEH